MEFNEQVLRRLLWIRHGCSKEDLYGNDGDMICNNCLLDFSRDPLHVIEQTLMKKTNDDALMEGVLEDLLGSVRLDYIRYRSRFIRRYISERLEPLIIKFLHRTRE